MKNWLNKSFSSGRVVFFLFIFNLIILILHLLNFNFILIDNTTILLMVLLLATPFAAHIKKIKWGDFELEKDIDRLKEDARELKSSTQSKSLAKLNPLEDQLRELSQYDSVLAFAKIRIEIEIRLKRLFTFSELGNSQNISSMMQVLVATGVISHRLRKIILSINSIVSRVIHGDDTPTEASIDKVIGVGIDALNELDRIYYEKIIKPNDDTIISKEELKKYAEGVYEVTSIVPLVKNPKLSKRILSKVQLDEFLEGYNEYAEFLVKVEKI